MNDEVHYLPVGAEERALLKWLRGSPYRDDLAAVRDALAAAAQAKVPAEALSFSPPASKPSHGDPRLDAIERRLDALERRATNTALGTVPSPTLVTPASLTLPAPAAPVAQPLPAPAADVDEDARIAMTIGGVLVQGASVGRFMTQVVEVLTSRGWLRPEHLPLKTGRSRYLLSGTPHHASGRPFIAPREVGGVHIETNYSYDNIRSAVEKLAAQLGLRCEVVRLVLRSADT